MSLPPIGETLHTPEVIESLQAPAMHWSLSEDTIVKMRDIDGNIRAARMAVVWFD